MDFEDFVKSLLVDSKEEYKKLFSKESERAPLLAKVRSVVPLTFDYSLNYSLEIIKKYHNWLLDNYNITPKK